MIDYVRALRRQLQELQKENAALRTERDIALIDRQCAVTELAHAHQLACDPGDVPAVLVHAMRSTGGPFQGVWIPLGASRLHALVDGAGYDADPAAEGRVWEWLLDHADQPPGHPVDRRAMPDRLLGVAWPSGEIAVSLALAGRDVTAAHRALRPRRGPGMLRALGLLLIPAAAAARAAIGLARDAQAVTAATASATTTAATTAATTALPAVTAVAISCTTLTACSPTVAAAAARPPADTAAAHGAYGASAALHTQTAAPGREPNGSTPAEEPGDEATRESEPTSIGCCPAEPTPADLPTPTPTPTPSATVDPSPAPSTSPAPEPSTAPASPETAEETPAPQQTRPTGTPTSGPQTHAGHPGRGHAKGRSWGRGRGHRHHPPGHARGHGRH